MKRKALIGRTIVVLLVLLFVIVFITYKNFRSASINDLRLILNSFGRYTPLVFAALCIIRGVLAIPCGLLSMLGGILFGPLPGTAITLIGLTAGSVLTFYLARLMGSRWTKHIIGNRLKNVDNFISRNGFYSVFLMRVIPILPYDVVSCISGMSKVGFPDYVLGTLAGSIPGVFVYVYFGDSMMAFSFKKIAVSLALTAALAITPVLYKVFSGAKIMNFYKNKY